MTKKIQTLGSKHWQALKLIDEGKMSLKDIAATVGWSADFMYDIYEGKDNCGTIGEMFQSELKKLEAKNVNKIKTLSKENQALALRLMNDFLRRKATNVYVSDDDLKLIATAYNAMAKSTPSVEIGSMQWNYTKGLTSEELVHEFTKLKSIAEGASKRGAVPAVGSRKAGVLPTPAKSRS